jgi:hypothetical protein
MNGCCRQSAGKCLSPTVSPTPLKKNDWHPGPFCHKPDEVCKRQAYPPCGHMLSTCSAHQLHAITSSAIKRYSWRQHALRLHECGTRNSTTSPHALKATRPAHCRCTVYALMSPDAACRDVSNTSADAASLTSWMQSHFCRLEYPPTIVLPNGEEVRCRHYRVTATAIVCSVVLFMLLLVTVLRCCVSWRVCCMCCKPMHSSGGWMDWVSSQWGRSEGAREWLRPLWKLFVALLDVGSDIWVLVQVRLQSLTRS